MPFLGWKPKQSPISSAEVPARRPKTPPPEGGLAAAARPLAAAGTSPPKSAAGEGGGTILLAGSSPNPNPNKSEGGGEGDWAGDGEERSEAEQRASAEEDRKDFSGKDAAEERREGKFGRVSTHTAGGGGGRGGINFSFCEDSQRTCRSDTPQPPPLPPPALHTCGVTPTPLTTTSARSHQEPVAPFLRFQTPERKVFKPYPAVLLTD